MAYEQRKHPRLPEIISVSVELSGQPSAADWTVVDLSVGGACLTTTSPPEVGAELNLDLVLGSAVSGDAYISAEGRVIWVKPSGEDEHSDVGVEFTSLLGESQRLIEHHIQYRRPH